MVVLHKRLGDTERGKLRVVVGLHEEAACIAKFLGFDDAHIGQMRGGNGKGHNRDSIELAMCVAHNACMQVELRLVRTPEQHAIYVQFFLQFFHTLAEFDDQLVMTAHGYPCWKPSLDKGEPVPRTLDEFCAFNKWVRDRCDIRLIYADGLPAGFVILCDLVEVLPQDVDHELMDFYIVPKLRGHGVGEAAARLAFETRRGRWVVYQLPRNAPAKAFWARVIGRYTGGRFSNLDDGAQQRFEN
jgi:predicted acetyltransferase